MIGKRTIYAHVFAMGFVCLVCVGLVVAVLFNASYDLRRVQLESMVQRRAYLVKELVRHDLADAEQFGEDSSTGPVLTQALKAYRRLGGFGETGEFTLARPEGNHFKFLLGPRLDEPELNTVDFGDSLAEPMRRALRGESDTMVGLDYRGETVFAAYAPVNGLGWGAVAKIDMREIWEPFVLIGLLAAAAALVAIAIIAYLFVRPMNGLIRELRERETRIRAIVETAVEGIITTDGSGTIQFINPAAEGMFGAAADAVVGSSISTLIPDFDPARFDPLESRETQSPAAGSGSLTRETKGRKNDGAMFPTEISKSILDLSGESAFTIIVRDISERKKSEEQLRSTHDRLAEMNKCLVEQHSKMIQTAKLSSIGLLASGVAHEINNPLAGVKSCLKSLAENKVPDDRKNQYFDTAREGLDRIQSIVRRLLDYARDRYPHQTTLSAADVVGSAVALVEPAILRKQLRIENQIGTNGLHLHADRQQLTQAVVNVLLNAVYAAPASSQIEISAVSENNRVGLRVVDHGAGIPPEDLSRLCDPFFTTKPVDEGTGLGLAVTLGFVHAHGGDLVFDSVEGSGTSVTIWLPVGKGNTTDEARDPTS